MKLIKITSGRKSKLPAKIRNLKIPEVRPSRLFRDTDRDGVPNVFDCRPRLRHRQDSGWLNPEENEEKFERYHDESKTDDDITRMTKSQRFKKASKGGYY